MYMLYYCTHCICIHCKCKCILYPFQALLRGLSDADHSIASLDACGAKLSPRVDAACGARLTGDKSRLAQRADTLRHALERQIAVLAADSSKLGKLRGGCDELDAFLKDATKKLHAITDKVMHFMIPGCAVD